MTTRTYDPEIAPIVPLLPITTDWSDVPAARRMMLEMFAKLPAAPQAAAERVRFADRVIPGAPDHRALAVRVYRPKGGDGAASGRVRDPRRRLHDGRHRDDGPVVPARRGRGSTPWWSRSSTGSRPSTRSRPASRTAMPRSSGLATEARLGVDAERIAVAGQSAGGGLAAGTALLARDRGGPASASSCSRSPSSTTGSTRRRCSRSSTRRCGTGRTRCGAGSTTSAPDTAARSSPYAAPARAKDLAGLPPAYVSTMEFDPLRDEGILYALRLLQAGVSVELHSYPGTFHGSGGLVPQRRGIAPRERGVAGGAPARPAALNAGLRKGPSFS